MLVVALLTLTAGGTAAANTPPDSAPPPSTEPVPASTYNVYMPENENFTACQSLAVQRPNCGSKARGGWRQTLVFVVIAAGLVGVGIRLYLSVRRRDGTVNAH